MNTIQMFWASLCQCCDNVWASFVNVLLGTCCRVTLNNMTNNCVFIQDIVLEALRGTDPSTHVATFGDSDVRFVGDWLAIQGLYTQPPQVSKLSVVVQHN